MKKIIALLFAFTLSASAVEFVQVSTVTVTNEVNTNGVTFVFNGDTRTGTNALTSTTWDVATNSASFTTNLYRQIIRYPFANVDYVEMTASNQFKIYARPNIIITNTMDGAYATVSISSNNIGELTVNISVPAENWPDQEDATNAFTQLVDALNTHSTSYINKSTNLVNYGNITLTNEDPSINIQGKTNSGGRIDFTFGDGGTDYWTLYATTNQFQIDATGIQLLTMTQEGDLTFSGLGDSLFSGNLEAAGTFEASGLVKNFSHLRTNISGLANGANSGLDIADRTYVKVSGPTAAFQIAGITNGTDGRVLILQNSTGYEMAVLNDSGLDGTAANRIYTGTGAGITNTNNPGVFRFIYDSELSRWIYTGSN